MKKLKKNHKKEKKGTKEKRENIKKDKDRERKKEKGTSRKTACILPETELSDFKLQTSVLFELIVAKVK